MRYINQAISGCYGEWRHPWIRSAQIQLDVSGFQNALDGGAFGINQSGNDLSLNFCAVPEPHEYALVTAFALLGLAFWRSRRSRKG